MQNKVPMVQETSHRFRKNVPGPFYTTGECMACGAPEHEAPELLAPLIGGNYDTYFVRQPATPDEVERACRALEVCCAVALRYGGTDPKIIRRLGNDPDYCDRLLPGGPIPRPDWLAEQRKSMAASNNDVYATQTEQILDEQKQQTDSERTDQAPGDWYDGFPLVEETRMDGWCYGAITEFDEPECHPDGCESGNGYVVAPDGLRTGLIWATGSFAAKWVPPVSEYISGVYEVAFPKPVKNLNDLVECFRSIVPQLQTLHVDRRNSS